MICMYNIQPLLEPADMTSTTYRLKDFHISFGSSHSRSDASSNLSGTGSLDYYPATTINFQKYESHDSFGLHNENGGDGHRLQEPRSQQAWMALRFQRLTKIQRKIN